MRARGKIVIKAVSGTNWSGAKSQQQYRTKTSQVACKLTAEEYAGFIASILRQASRPVENYDGQMIVAHDEIVPETAEACHLAQGRMCS